MPSSPSSGGMLSSWAVATRDKVESKLIDIPFNSGKRRPGDAFERSLWAAFSSYDTLPTVPTKSASLERPKKSPVVHLPPLDPTRFPRLSTAARPSPQPNELSDFTSPQQLAKARRVAARRAREAARKAELDTIARAADTALADERAPARLKEIFKRWDENGDGRISLAEAEAMYQDAMTELMPPAEPAANDDAEDATPPPPPLGCAWLKLEKKPDDGLELKIEKLAEILESGKLEFTPEEVRQACPRQACPRHICPTSALFSSHYDSHPARMRRTDPRVFSPLIDLPTDRPIDRPMFVSSSHRSCPGACPPRLSARCL